MGQVPFPIPTLLPFWHSCRLAKTNASQHVACSLQHWRRTWPLTHAYSTAGGTRFSTFEVALNQFNWSGSTGINQRQLQLPSLFAASPLPLPLSPLEPPAPPRDGCLQVALTAFRSSAKIERNFSRVQLKNEHITNASEVLYTLCVA